MPFKGENGWISMFIFLPPYTSIAIDAFLENLTPEILDKALSMSYEHFHHSMQVKLSIPKFSIAKTTKLIPVY